jgi:hypothetical protein
MAFARSEVAAGIGTHRPSDIPKCYGKDQANGSISLALFSPSIMISDFSGSLSLWVPLPDDPASRCEKNQF